MFHNNPLTCLFVVATLCVDLALIIGANYDERIAATEGLAFFVYNYGLPAQISALAIWAVLSQVHRLIKAAWVTLAGGMLLLLTWWVIQSQYRGELVAFCFMQLSLVLIGCALMKQLGWITPLKESNTRGENRFQFSLVEIFGWTIIVAFWAFALRYADFRIVTQELWWFWILCAVLIPLTLVSMFFKQLQTGARLLRLMMGYLLALALYVIARIYDQGPLPFWSFAMAVTQITYITAWWAVMRMDEVMAERRRVTSASRETLAIFNPTTSDEQSTASDER